MQINDKVYVRSGASKIYQGVIVARKWVFTPLPARRYVVKKVSSAEGIASVITAAFYGPADDLAYCDNDDLILMPVVEVE